MVWDPPDRIQYLWHLFLDRDEATDVTVTFTQIEGGSRVRLVQTGFERLGPEKGIEARTHQTSVAGNDRALSPDPWLRIRA